MRMAGAEAVNSENSWVIGRVSSRRREGPGDWPVTLKSTSTCERTEELEASMGLGRLTGSTGVVVGEPLVCPFSQR